MLIFVIFIFNPNIKSDQRDKFPECNFQWRIGLNDKNKLCVQLLLCFSLFFCQQDYITATERVSAVCSLIQPLMNKPIN